jgi:cytochrome c-type biogenesis protein CcmH/NrfF
LLGAILGMWPTSRELLREEEPRRRTPWFRFSPATAVVALAIALATVMAWAGVASAQDDTSSSLHAGTVVLNNPTERQLFGRLLCQCGDCARLPLDTCACGWADDKRAEVREMLAAGVLPTKIQESYRAEFGGASLAIPSDRGLDRALWAVPVGLILLAMVLIVMLGRRWQQRGVALHAAAATTAASELEYDSRLDEELKRLEDD